MSTSNQTFDEQYRDLIISILRDGEMKENRTGVKTLFKIGAYLAFNCADSIPLLTTKRVYWKSAFAEMIGFIRGYSSAADFRSLGCNVWNKDANENVRWIESPHRKGEDDLGRIYGVQWRSWEPGLDQLSNVIHDISLGIDNRREIVTAWNPSEMSQMALPPCHFSMMFSLTEQDKTVNLSVFQRSWDCFLGTSYNVTQYSFLLYVIARITNKKIGKLHFHVVNVHLYEPHIPLVKEQLKRNPKRETPTLEFFGAAKDLYGQSFWDFIQDTKIPLENWVKVENYNPHPAIKAEMYTESKKHDNRNLQNNQ